MIVVDDGLATGSSMIAALQALRDKHPARLVCAVPVAPPDTLGESGRWWMSWYAWKPRLILPPSASFTAISIRSGTTR